jgi:uncharacterized protein
MSEITYFDNAGSENTENVLRLALARYNKGGIDEVIIASSHGGTARLAAKVFEGTGVQLLIFGEVLDGDQSPSKDVCEELTGQGHKVIWGVHINSMSTFTGDLSARLVSETFRRISEGFKVVCEIVLIATSQGFLRTGEKVLAVAGTNRGADTAIVANAAPITQFKDFEIHEILCKPYRRARP